MTPRARCFSASVAGDISLIPPFRSMVLVSATNSASTKRTGNTTEGSRTMSVAAAAMPTPYGAGVSPSTIGPAVFTPCIGHSCRLACEAARARVGAVVTLDLELGTQLSGSRESAPLSEQVRCGGKSQLGWYPKRGGENCLAAYKSPPREWPPHCSHSVGVQQPRQPGSTTRFLMPSVVCTAPGGVSCPRSPPHRRRRRSMTSWRE